MNNLLKNPTRGGIPAFENITKLNRKAKNALNLNKKRNSSKVFNKVKSEEYLTRIIDKKKPRTIKT